MPDDRTASAQQAPTLEQTRRRIAAWRGTRTQKPGIRQAMPAALWAAAVVLAQQHGLSPTARALHVNYLTLKKRLAATGFVPRPRKTLDGRRDGRRVTTRAHDGTRRGARGRQHHGLTTLKRAIAQLGARPLDQALDPQSPIGRALAEWRRELTADLGGAESITAAQGALIELALRTRLILDTVDAFILTMESPVNRRLRSVFPVILQRQTLANGLARFLEALGLERRKPVTLDLAHALAARSREPEGPEPDAPDEGEAPDA
jgi:hypothetical protein